MEFSSCTFRYQSWIITVVSMHIDIGTNRREWIKVLGVRWRSHHLCYITAFRFGLPCLEINVNLFSLLRFLSDDLVQLHHLVHIVAAHATHPSIASELASRIPWSQHSLIICIDFLIKVLQWWLSNMLCFTNTFPDYWFAYEEWCILVRITGTSQLSLNDSFILIDNGVYPDMRAMFVLE